MKIRKDWSRSEIWSSSKTPGPRSSVISCKMRKKWGPLSSLQSKWFRDSCLLHRLFFQSLKIKNETCIFYFAYCSLETNRESILLFQIIGLQTENFCLSLHGGSVTGVSTTKSPQTAKDLCKKEHIAISFLSFLFSAFCAAVDSINTLFFLIK